jgi:hypothetical protein
MDVGILLHNLALGQFESLFEENESCGEVLPGFTSHLPLHGPLELQLREALEREAATAEILRVIASSPTDFGLIFAAIAERSNKLVSGLSTAVFQLIDDTLHLAAFTRRSEAADAALINLFPLKLSDVVWYERTIREARPVQIEDCESGFADHSGLLDLSRKRGFRSVALIPLFRRSGSRSGRRQLRAFT